MKKQIILGLLILSIGATSADAKNRNESKKSKGTYVVFDCYGGMTTCGTSYMCCEGSALSSDDQIRLNMVESYFDCGDMSIFDQN